MRVNYNNEYFKIPKSEIPKTFQEFTQTTLQEVLAPEPLPSRFTLCYFDIENYPIKVKNERNYQAMCQEMEKLQQDLRLCLTSEQQNKLIQNMSCILSSMPSMPSLPGAQSTEASIAQNSPVQSVKQEVIQVIKLEDEEEKDELKVLVDDAGNDKETNYTEVYTHENVEWIVNESDALRKGLSERIKKNENKDEEKKGEKSLTKKKRGRKPKRIHKLENELRDLEREQKDFLDFLEKCAEREQSKIEHQNTKLEDLVEKKLQTLPIREMVVKQEQNKPLNKSKGSDDDSFPINTLEAHYRVQIGFGNDFLEVTALQEVIQSRLKSEKNVLQSHEKRPNTTVNDGNIKNLVKDLLKILKSEGHDVLNIENLTLNFKNCRNLSKYGISYLFQAINDEFKNVRTLNLDFSFSKRQSSLKTSHLLPKIALELGHLENLSLNLSNRCDLTKEETNMIIESLEKNSKDSLKSLNLFLPTMFFVGPETKNNFKAELGFIESLNVFPLL